MLRIFVLWLILALPGAAQTTPPASEADAPVETDAAGQLIEILRDEAAREALIRQLEASAAEVAEPAAATEGAPPEISLARQIAEYTRATAEGATGMMFDVVASAGTVLGAFT